MTADFNVGIVAGERQLQRIFVPADRAGDGYASVIERSKQQKRQTAGFARPFMSCRMPRAQLLYAQLTSDVSSSFGWSD